MRIFKIIIDVLLLINTLLLTSLDYFGTLGHEVLGISMGILIIIHIITNWNWIKNVSKNFSKVNKKTKVMYIINILTMIVYLGAVIFGIMISREIFKLKTNSNYNFIVTHNICGRLAIIVMFIHVGMHLDIIFNKIENRKVKYAIYILYIIIAILLSGYSIFKLTHSFAWAMVFGM